jgi:metallo-beta-lactamase family protein
MTSDETQDDDMPITLTSHGAAGEVTGSKHLLDTGSARVLVDCGLFQGPRSETRERNRTLPFDPGTLTACLNTHGHLDHVGSYPTLVKQGYDGPIVATPATRDIAALVMHDAAKVQQADARFLARRGRPFAEPLYDDDDALQAIARFVGVSYHRPYDLAPGVRVTLHDAGHILGSATARFELEGGVAVGFSGDLGRSGTPILRDPEPLPPVDWLVCESTYGNRRHDDKDTAEEELAAVVRETIARGGRVIVPSFAVGRTQELVYLLHRLHDEKRIPSVPVFVDSPMAVSATAIFKAHPDCYDAEARADFFDQGESPFSFDRLSYVVKSDQSKRINTLREPCIVISSSGMCEAGRILHHLANGVGDPRNTILIVGFMGRGTLGRSLADRRPQVRIFGETHDVRARVKILNAFSAHADYVEIGDWVQRLDLGRLKGIFLVHGEPDAQAHLAEHLRARGVRRIEPLLAGKPVSLS